MFNALLQGQCRLGLNRFFPALTKLSYSDFAIIDKEPKLKALVSEDSTRVLKKDFKEHFIEKFFVNKFDEKALEYPQMDTIQEVDILRRHCEVAQYLITGKSDNSVCETDSKKAVSLLKKHELAGFKLPRLKSGFGYLSSEYTFMQEVLASDPSLSKTVSEHEDFGIYFIYKFGSDLQKAKYLLKLSSGENIACFANIEKETLRSLEPNTLSTSAVLTPDNESYIISGTKCWVYNAGSADVFVLSANIRSEGTESKSTLFLVDRNTPGVEIHEPIKTVGLKNLSICDVTFNNVVVPKSSVLGNVCEGDLMIKSALSQGKLNNGGQCLGALRILLKHVVQHCIHSEFFKKDKHEIEYFRIKAANIASRIYVIESMTYLLTGRLDSHDNPDVFLESLIVKIHASEVLRFCVQEALEIMGPEFFTCEDLVQLTRDSQFYASCDDANDYLRVELPPPNYKLKSTRKVYYQIGPDKISQFFQLILAMSGLNYNLKYKNERTFWQFFRDIVNLQQIRKLFFNSSQFYDYKNVAEGYLHLKFSQESCFFEDVIAKLTESTNLVIRKYKDKVFERHTELRHIADMAIAAYAMAATLGRASRAYCIGVKLQEIDLLCTEAEIRRYSLRVRQLRQLIGEPDSQPKYSDIATSILNSSRYSDLCPVIKNLTIR